MSLFYNLNLFFINVIPPIIIKIGIKNNIPCPVPFNNSIINLFYSFFLYYFFGSGFGVFVKPNMYSGLMS